MIFYFKSGARKKAWDTFIDDDSKFYYLGTFPGNWENENFSSMVHVMLTVQNARDFLLRLGYREVTEEEAKKLEVMG